MKQGAGGADVAPRVDEDVLGLEVAVDDALLLEVDERLDEVRRVELRVPEGDRAVVGGGEALEELAALNAVEEEVAEVAGLVGAVEVEEEGVVDEEEDAELREDGLDLLLVGHALLAEHLEGVGDGLRGLGAAPLGRVDDHLDAAEAPLAERLFDLEVAVRRRRPLARARAVELGLVALEGALAQAEEGRVRRRDAALDVRPAVRV